MCETELKYQFYTSNMVFLLNQEAGFDTSRTITLSENFVQKSCDGIKQELVNTSITKT